MLKGVATHLAPGLELAEAVAKAANLPPDTPLLKAATTLGNGSRISCQDTVPLALWLSLNHLGEYEKAVRAAIAAGGDTDTTAAIVGSVVAAYGGVACIPAQWRALAEPLPEGHS